MFGEEVAGGPEAQGPGGSGSPQVCSTWPAGPARAPGVAVCLQAEGALPQTPGSRFVCGPRPPWPLSASRRPSGTSAVTRSGDAPSTQTTEGLLGRRRARSWVWDMGVGRQARAGWLLGPSRVGAVQEAGSRACRGGHVARVGGGWCGQRGLTRPVWAVSWKLALQDGLCT